MQYRVITEQFSSPDAGTYIAYGIEAVSAGAVFRTIGDISPDKEKVCRLAERFNHEKLAPEHLDEAIENFLYDFEG